MRINVKKSLLVLFSVSFLFFAHLNPASAAETPFRVGTWKTAQTIAPFFYQDFLSVPVEVLAFTNPADQKTALLAGSLEMCGTTIAHAIHSASQGQPVVLVTALCNRCSALVAAKDGPVRSVSDLKGRRIGYVPGTMHEVLLREALTRNGLSPETDVELMRVDFFDMGTALSRGAIDAFLSGEPFPTLAVREGYGRILAYPYYEDSIGTINAGMLTTRKNIEENRGRVLELVRAHVKATLWLKEHPEAWCGRAGSFGTEKTVVEESAKNIDLSWLIDETFVKQARALGERMEALKVIERQPDYDALFDLSFVEEVKKELGL